MAETLEDTRHLLTAGVCAPLVVDLRDLAGGVRIFNDADFRFRIAHKLLTGCSRNGRRLAHPSKPKRAVNKTTRTLGSAPLEHQTLIVVFTSNSLAIKIFEQRDGIFSRQTGDLLKACDIDCMAAEFAHFCP
jgi:hypothetical protein